MEPTNGNKEITRPAMAFGAMTQGMTGNPVIDIFLCPERFEQMQRGANLLAASKIVPAHYQGNPGGCFIAMNVALQLGLEPFSFMQKTYVIRGKLGIEAQVAIAVCNQRHVFKEPLEYVFEGSMKNKPIDRRCTCSGILSANGKKVSLSLSWEEVEAEGWNKKDGSKWMTIPDQMFRYRTALWLIRTYAPEVLLGLQTVDELEDSRMIDITPPKNEAAASALMGGADIVKEEKPADQEKPAEEPPKKKKQHAEKPAEKTAEKPTENAQGQPETKQPITITIEDVMSEFTGPSYVFGSPMEINNGNAVLKNLQEKAGINDATFPLMIKSVADGVLDREKWTPEQWNNVRNMLLSVIRRGAEQKIRMLSNKK